MYIVLEGVVGTWKTTQSKKLHEHFQQAFPDVENILVREPGGTEIAETIRNVVQARLFTEVMHPLTDAYLYASARAQLINNKLKAVLDNGGNVIADRSFCSSLTYQGYAQWLGMDRIWEINKHAVQGVLPNKILFLDFDVKKWLERTFDKDGDKREKLDISFFEKVYEGYNKLFDFEPTKDLMHRIDASGGIEEVFERILESVRGELKENFEDVGGFGIGTRKLITENIENK